MSKRTELEFVGIMIDDHYEYGRRCSDQDSIVIRLATPTGLVRDVKITDEQLVKIVQQAAQTWSNWRRRQEIAEQERKR